MITMGLDSGLSDSLTCFTRKFRWLLTIPTVSNDGIDSLPPSKSARPNLEFKEMQIEHLNETIFYPAKPDFKPIQLTLYDFKKSGLTTHPVMRWIKKVYDIKQGKWSLPTEAGFVSRAQLDLYDGCGTIIETWVYENAWPRQIDFGDLDMGNSEILTCEITLRYARAYFVDLR